MIGLSIWGKDLEWRRVEHDKKKTWWLADLCNGYWSVCLWKMNDFDKGFKWTHFGE